MVHRPTLGSLHARFNRRKMLKWQSLDDRQIVLAVTMYDGPGSGGLFPKPETKR